MAALANSDDNPTAWCLAKDCALTGAMALELGGPPPAGEGFSPFTTYLLGRALMLGAVHAPCGTNGLSDTYELVFPLGWGGLAALAADEELATSLDTKPDARDEVAAEAARLASAPWRAATGFDRARTEAAITAAGSPTSLAACRSFRILDLPIDLPFARVLQVIGKSDPAFAAQLLDTIGNPAIVAAMLPNLGIMNLHALVQLLPHFVAVFDEQHVWTRRSAAWVALLSIERLLLGQLKAGADGPTAEPSPQALIDEVVTALDTRPDGHRLELEWLAHMAWQVAQSIALPLGSPTEAKTRLVPVLELLQAVAERLRALPKINESGYG